MSESQGDLRLDGETQTVAQQYRLARSVGGRGGHEGPEVQSGPSPTSASIRTLSETPNQHHGRGYGRCRRCGRTRRAHTCLQNRPEGGFAQAPTARHLPVDQKNPKNSETAPTDDTRPDCFTFT